jgi:hypothetical protein
MAWPLAAAIAGAVFLFTTPYAVLDFATFRRDLGFLQDWRRRDTSGTWARAGFLFTCTTCRAISRGWAWRCGGLARLDRDPPAAAPRRCARRARAADLRRADRLRAIEAERYLLPLLPLAAALVAETVLAAADRLPPRRAPRPRGQLRSGSRARRFGSGGRAVRASDADTRIAARRWCERTCRSDDLVVQELYCAPLLGRVEWLTRAQRRPVRSGEPRGARRYDALRWFSSARFPLAVVGSTDTA